MGADGLSDGPVVPWTTATVVGCRPPWSRCSRAERGAADGDVVAEEEDHRLGAGQSCTRSEASEPGVKPLPANVMTSPPARPQQTGAVGLVLLHVTPAAVDVSVSVCVAADALVTLVTSNTVPATRVKTPTADINLEAAFETLHVPPSRTAHGGTVRSRPMRSVFPVLLLLLNLVATDLLLVCCFCFFSCSLLCYS